jgi:NADH:ubiquinone oxidoreductase subunit 6 (subunit J)
VGSALLRILYAIPSLIVLAILAFVGAVAWVIAVVLALVNEKYPDSLWRFLGGIVRWEACLFAYLASLVDRYPPFRLEAGSVSPVTPSS